MTVKAYINAYFDDVGNFILTTGTTPQPTNECGQGYHCPGRAHPTQFRIELSICQIL